LAPEKQTILRAGDIDRLGDGVTASAGLPPDWALSSAVATCFLRRQRARRFSP
jgi:hypothetical protein